jgi:NAD(P)-dependent dehydrogenase (short-subunit alcohol dehydrogenase family)
LSKVLITGCSSGFGMLTALRFAREGDLVFATMRKPENAPDDLVRAIESERLSITLLPLDVCDPTQIAAVFAETGAVDIVINNAGVELRSSIEDATDEDVRRQFETNVFGAVAIMRAALPSMRERGRGTIVNLSSIAGLVSRPFGGYYAATKHALEAISEALHYEVRPFGVRVILIEPGQYETRILENAFEGKGFGPSSPYWEASERFDVALGKLRLDDRRADPREVADLIYTAVHDPTPKLRYLAGEDAKLIATASREMEFEAYEELMRQTLDWTD